MVWIVPLSEGCGVDPEKESDALLQQVSRVRAAREEEDVLRNSEQDAKDLPQEDQVLSKELSASGGE